MATSPSPVITEEESKLPAPWRASSITPPGLIEAIVALGWTFEQTQLGERDLTIADAAGAAVPPPALATTEGFPGVAKLPHLAYARMSLDSHFFSMDGLDLYVEVCDVSESWGRQWADAIMGLGQPQAVPMGQGFTVPMGTVIDAGDRLIRASWGSSLEPGLGIETPAPVPYETQLLSLQPQGG